MKKTVYLIILLASNFIIQLHAQTWQLNGNEIVGDAAGIQFGYSVSMPNSTTIAVGAPYKTTTNGDSSGVVKVYTLSGTTWGQKGNDIIGESSDDLFGFSIDMPDGNTIAVGAPYNKGANNDSTAMGHVRIYTWNGSSWNQKGNDIDGGKANLKSGYAVSMPDANTVAVGIPGLSSGLIGVGGVRIYKWDGSSWIQKGSDLYGENAGDEFGVSVTMPDNGIIAFGSILNSNGSLTNQGSVRVYVWDGTSAWNQRGSDIDGNVNGANSGASVAMANGNSIVIGATGQGGIPVGGMRIFTWDGSSWTQKGSDIDGSNSGDKAGYSVSFPDADVVAMGAPNSTSGYVKVYKWSSSNSSWEALGNNINGKSGNDQCGWAISMPDANNIAIASPLNDGGGSNSGQARAFNTCQAVSASVSETACKSYTSPSGKYTWTTSGTYQDTILKTDGCDSFITFNLTINTNDKTVNHTSSDYKLTANESGASYQWVDCDNNYASISGETNQNYIYSASGNYGVIITKNNCTDTSDCTSVTYNPPSSISANKKSEIWAYQNMGSNKIYVELGEKYHQIKLSVQNIIGQKIIGKHFFNSSKIEFDLTHDKGIYLINLDLGNNKLHTIKFIKE